MKKKKGSVSILTRQLLGIIKTIQVGEEDL